MTASVHEKISLLLELSNYRYYDSIVRAEKYARQAVSYSKSSGDELSLSNSLLTLGRVLYARNNPDSALSCLYHSQEIKTSLRDITNLEWVYFLQARNHQRIAETQKAIEKLQAAIRICELNRNFALEGRCYIEMAHCCRAQNLKVEMGDYLDKAGATFVKGGDTLLRLNGLMNLGIFYGDIGQGEKSVKSMLQSLRMAEAIGDSLTMGYAYSNLSGFFAAFSSKSSAIEYNLKALEIFKRIGNKKGMAYSMNNLGGIFYDKKDIRRAVTYFSGAGKLKEEVFDWQGACFMYNNVAEVYIRQKDFDNAWVYLKKSAPFAVRANDGLSRATTLYACGLYYSGILDHTRALDFFEESLAIAERLKLEGVIADNLTAISAEYQSEGKAAEALAFYKKFNARRDSLQRMEDRKNIAELSFKYETEKKESQVQALKRKIAEGYFFSRSFVLGYVFVGIILLFTAVFFIYRYNYKIRTIISSLPVLNTDLTSGRKRRSGIDPDQASKPALTEDQQQLIWDGLSQIMKNEKLYLNSKLKLSELAGRLNTNTTYLSKVINDKSGENFCNFLNQLRILEAQNLLSDPENQYLTIEGIAQSVGFNSKSAFNSSFKKYTSQTPSEFMTVSQNKESALS